MPMLQSVGSGCPPLPLPGNCRRRWEWPTSHERKFPGSWHWPTCRVNCFLGEGGVRQVLILLLFSGFVSQTVFFCLMECGLMRAIGGHSLPPPKERRYSPAQRVSVADGLLLRGPTKTGNKPADQSLNGVPPSSLPMRSTEGEWCGFPH